MYNSINFKFCVLPHVYHYVCTVSHTHTPTNVGNKSISHQLKPTAWFKPFSTLLSITYACECSDPHLFSSTSLYLANTCVFFVLLNFHCSLLFNGFVHNLFEFVLFTLEVLEFVFLLLSMYWGETDKSVLESCIEFIVLIYLFQI